MTSQSTFPQNTVPPAPDQLLSRCWASRRAEGRGDIQGIRIPSRHEPRCSERVGKEKRDADVMPGQSCWRRYARARDVPCWPGKRRPCKPACRSCVRVSARATATTATSSLVSRRDSRRRRGMARLDDTCLLRLLCVVLTSCGSLESYASRKTPSGNAGNPPRPSARPRGTASDSPSSPA